MGIVKQLLAYPFSMEFLFDEKQRNAYFDVTQSDENITYIILKSRLVDLMNDDFRTPITPVYTNGKIIELLVYTEVL